MCTRRNSQIDPLTDPRWPALLERHTQATVFHTRGWLEALRRTYGYQPLAVTTDPGASRLVDGLVYCRVKTWLSGTRVISLPFSDHCEPLVESKSGLAQLINSMKEYVDAASYVEIRPIATPEVASMGLSVASSFCLHRLDLRPAACDLFRRFHKSCIQRKIKRAERESLEYDAGTSDSLLARFYDLLVITRRRQQLLPQPISWFRNLVNCLGDQLKIHLVSKAGNAIAGILTLRHKDTMVYKYGCSDKTHSSLGGTQLLFWNAILEAKALGLSQFDLGRSDWDNRGLLAFKDRWGAERVVIRYWRYCGKHHPASWPVGVANRIFRHIPNGLRPIAGSLMYRHYA